MATQAQVDANRRNATHSTGPRTATGKAASSRNHTTLGLYSREAFVKSGEQDEYTAFQNDLFVELNPANLVEEPSAHEILGAAWRLRCCARAEARLGDFDPETDKFRRSIERVRTAAQLAFNRAVTLLRKLQASNKNGQGLSPQQPARSSMPGSAASNCKPEPEAPEASPNVPEELQIPRSAQCPCGSGQKYKRCCGQNAPPVLSRAA